jgi:predicted ATP-grasp superfamily ATP-dependent carboligase
MVIHMETVLTVGINTRSVVCSLKKLGYQVYSADYFGSVDLKRCADQMDSVLDQSPEKSCGIFIEKFRALDLQEIAREFADDADHIICLSSISPKIFPRDKIRGNDGHYDSKATLYKALSSNFNLPLTFLPSNQEETNEIVNSHPEYEFILKPNQGSGGYGVRVWEPGQPRLKGDYILQEFIPGQIISASVLSTTETAKTIINSENIVHTSNLGQLEPFGYCGNIVPPHINDEIKKLAEEVVLKLGLVGSNGVDFIIYDDEIYILEVNPRIQGTFECAELSLNINMAEAHLKACQGQIMDIPSPQKYAVKMVVHAKERSKVGNLNISDVYDIPHNGVIIEKGEPVCTVLSSGRGRFGTIKKTESIVAQVYQNLVSKRSLDNM